VAYGPAYGNVITNAEAQFRQLAEPLIAWSLNAADLAHATVSTPAENEKVQLFLFTRSPESFQIADAGLGREVGYVLYQLDLFKPGTTE
jgi:hypothetical protein